MKTRYACPCGRGYIEEKQDYTPGFVMELHFCTVRNVKPKYYIEFGNSELHWELLPITEKQKHLKYNKEELQW